jgi:hypothetical protein
LVSLLLTPTLISYPHPCIESMTTITAYDRLACSQYIPVNVSFKSDASKPIIDLIAHTQSTNHYEYLTKDKLISPLSAGKDGGDCTCSHCCLYLSLEGKEEKKEKSATSDGYISLKEVQRSSHSSFKHCLCIYCKKSSNMVSFALPSGNVAWTILPVCKDCVSAGKVPKYRIHHQTRCTKCNTDSMSVVGGFRNQTVWEAFTCACESIRHFAFRSNNDPDDPEYRVPNNFGLRVGKPVSPSFGFFHFQSYKCVLS